MLIGRSVRMEHKGLAKPLSAKEPAAWIDGLIQSHHEGAWMEKHNLHEAFSEMESLKQAEINDRRENQQQNPQSINKRLWAYARLAYNLQYRISSHSYTVGIYLLEWRRVLKDWMDYVKAPAKKG